MKKIIYLFFVFCFYSKITTAFAQCAVEAGMDQTIICGGTALLNAEPKWMKIHEGLLSLSSVYFVNVDTGYTVGLMGTILKTTDGGTSWISKSNSSSTDFSFVYFVNADTGYITGTSGLIIKTTDGGDKWDKLSSSTNEHLSSICFINSDTGYVVGKNGTIIKTIDGGNIWTVQTIVPSYDLNSVFFANALTGYSVGNNVLGTQSAIYKTSNGGTTWSTIKSYTNKHLSSVYFTDAYTGYVVGGGGSILKTTDGGLNWNIQMSNVASSLQSVYFTDASTGYIVGPEGPGTCTIIKTTNGGNTWVALSNDATDWLSSVFFPNANTGFAAGGGGVILKSPFIDSFLWSPAMGLSATNIRNPMASPTSTTTYKVMTASNGCYATDSVTVHVNPFIVNAGTDKTIICKGTTQLGSSITTNYTGNGTLKYKWSPSTGLNNDTLINPTTNIHDLSYTVTVATPNGCVSSDDVSVNLTSMDKPEICVVTVNSANKNIIVWNKQASTSINKFYIYRETNITDNYERIGAVLYDSLNIFTDTLSHPDVQSNKYKISILDSCGLESSKSDFHKTMHLSINKGIGSTWNLIWEPYIGFNVSTYNIYRGNNTDNMVLIGTSPGSNTQYSDVSAPSDNLYYQVEVISPYSCNPIYQLKNSSVNTSIMMKSVTYNSSRSNIVTNNISDISETTNKSGILAIYPNPASELINLSINEINNGVSILNIYDIMGSLVKTEILEQNQQQINISELNNGIYLIEIKTQEWTKKQKLIIQN